MKKEPADLSDLAPAAPKLKFAPKVRPRTAPKIVVKKESQEAEESVDKELLDKLRTAKVNGGFGYQSAKGKNKDPGGPAQLAFGNLSSSALKSRPVQTSSSTLSAGDLNVKVEKEYVEPWNYETTNYPCTLPWRRPYSGNPDVLDQVEFGESSNNALDDFWINPAEEIGLMDESSERKLLLFQLPSSLPLPRRQHVAAESSGTSKKNGGNPDVQGCPAEELPSGLMGKLMVYKSGKMQLKLGDVLFDVSPGSSCNFTQEAVVINAKDKHCSNLGPVRHRVVMTPNIDQVLESLEKLE